MLLRKNTTMKTIEDLQNFEDMLYEIRLVWPNLEASEQDVVTRWVDDIKAEFGIKEASPLRVVVMIRNFVVGYHIKSSVELADKIDAAFNEYAGWYLHDASEIVLMDSSEKKQLIKLVSCTFSQLLHSELSQEDMNKLQLQNLSPEYKGDTVCASHNYCDANQVMINAMELNGYAYPMYDTDEPEYEAWASVIDAAWSLSKSKNFGNI